MICFTMKKEAEKFRLLISTSFINEVVKNLSPFKAMEKALFVKLSEEIQFLLLFALISMNADEKAQVCCVVTFEALSRLLEERVHIYLWICSAIFVFHVFTPSCVLNMWVDTCKGQLALYMLIISFFP